MKKILCAKSQILMILSTIVAVTSIIFAVAYPSTLSIVMSAALSAASCFAIFRKTNSSESSSQQVHIEDELTAQTLKKLKQVFSIMSTLGPHARLSDVKQSIVYASSKALETDTIALFTIDPCLGGIECECTESVTGDIQHAFLELAGNLVTDRDCKDSWVFENISKGIFVNKTLYDRGIGRIVASPIRSEVGASGALAAFYPTDQPVKSYNCIIGAIAAQASAMISYSMTIEQSSSLLDDLAGVNQELSVQATIDGLTGLANHRTFQQTLQELCRHTSASRGNRSFCLIMSDVDHFKIYNDTYGHQAGDTVLRTVARVLSSKLRQGDMAARYGGEEFALILKGVNKDQAKAIVNRIRSTVSRQAFDKGTVTISMGIAEYPIDATKSSELIEKADRALYHAKITGRNRIVAWGSTSDVDRDPEIAPTNNSRKRVLVIESAYGPDAGDIQANLSNRSCVVSAVHSAIEALDILRTQVFDIAFVNADALSKISTLKEISSIHPQMPIVLITTSQNSEVSREAIRHGASDILLSPYNPVELPMLVERNVERSRLERERMAQRGVGLMLQSIDALVSAIDAKDHHTSGHSQRVTAIALSIADELSIPAEERSALEFASRLHDIGKLALPDSALNKESQLTEKEWDAMRQHPIMGSKIVGAIDELAYVSTIIRHHHERLNGTGYPDGLRNEAIPYPSRIIAVADAYEAMTAERSYRSKLTPMEAFMELKKRAGTFYSPEIVNALGEVLMASGELIKQQDQKAA